MKRNKIPIGRFLGFAALGAMIVIILVACGVEQSPAPGNQNFGNQSPQQTQGPGGQSFSQPTPTSAPRATVSAPTNIRGAAGSVEYLQPDADGHYYLANRVTAAKGQVICSLSDPNRPCDVTSIQWGADTATYYCNGGVTTRPGSLCADAGLNFRIVRVDDVATAAGMFISGQTPFFRGTADMANCVADAARDHGIELVAIDLFSRSTGGDGAAIRTGKAKDLYDLRGKTVVTQHCGPQIALIGDVMNNAKYGRGDFNLKVTRDLSIPPYAADVYVDEFSAFVNDDNVALATMISPDLKAVTSPGEYFVPDAKVAFTTKGAAGLIFDMYFVNRKFYEANRADIEKFVHAHILSQAEVERMYKNRSSSSAAEYNTWVKLWAKEIRDSEILTADIDDMIGGMTFAHFKENESFFTGKGANYRTFETAIKESQDTLMALGMLSAPVTVHKADWNWEAMKQGATVVSSETPTPQFGEKTQQEIERRAHAGTLEEVSPYSKVIYFGKNEVTFDPTLYKNDIADVLEWAEKWPGASMSIEGYTDVARYEEIKAMSQEEFYASFGGISKSDYLGQLPAGAKIQAKKRARDFKNAILAEAEKRGIYIDPSQLHEVGLGFEHPVYPNPVTEDEKAANRRVVFRLVPLVIEN